MTDGFRAVEVAARTQPAVVVAEIGLEGLSGGDLVRQLLSHRPRDLGHLLHERALAAHRRPAARGGRLGLRPQGGRPRGGAPAIRSVLDGNVTLSHRIGGQLAERFVAEATQRRELEDDARRGLGTARVADDREGGLPREHLARAPDAGHRRQGHRVRAEEPRHPGGGARRVPRAARGLAREAHDADRRDADDRRSGPRDPDAEARRRRPRADPAARRRRGREAAPDPRRSSTCPTGSRPRRTPCASPRSSGSCSTTRADTPPTTRSSSFAAARCSKGVVVSVTDHGAGVQRDIVTKAFREPFSAGEDILRKERAGAGVGLHMARQLVLQHGGIMWADPLPAGGTRFSFVIPARQGQTISSPPSLGEGESARRGQGRPRPLDPCDARRRRQVTRRGLDHRDRRGLRARGCASGPVGSMLGRRYLRLAEDPESLCARPRRRGLR